MKPAQRRSYADVLGEMSRKMNPERTETEITIVKDKIGLGHNTHDKIDFSNELRESIWAKKLTLVA